MQKKIEYLLIGNGKLASHLSFYFDSQKVDYQKWDRNSSNSFNSVLPSCRKILLAISDDSIKNFISEYSLENSDKIIIHFSGSLFLKNINSAHPLMTFGENLYSKEFYKSIPFITEKGKMPFKELFPELSNPNFQINSNDKPYYHAWCSMAGNFTTILWQNFQDRLRTKFDIPAEAMIPYQNKIIENIIGNKHPLTGPFARKDFKTIEKHRAALEEDNFLRIYNEFYEYFFNNNIDEVNIENS